MQNKLFVFNFYGVLKELCFNFNLFKSLNKKSSAIYCKLTDSYKHINLIKILKLIKCKIINCEFKGNKIEKLVINRNKIDNKQTNFVKWKIEEKK